MRLITRVGHNDEEHVIRRPLMRLDWPGDT